MALAPPATIDSEDRFDEAVNAFRKRVPMRRDEWDELDVAERKRAFTVSKVTEARVLQHVFDALDSSIEEGMDFEAFKDEVAVDLVESWGGEIPGRLETIFRTNLLGSYADGRYEIYSSPAVREARPYLRFDGVEDDRECEECDKLRDTIRPAEEWEEKGLMPPLHHNCRDGLSPVSREEAEEAGIADEMPDVEVDDGFGLPPAERGENWIPDLSGLSPELRAMVEDAIESRDQE